MNTERGNNPDSRVKQSSSQQRMKRNCSSINDFFEDFDDFFEAADFAFLAADFAFLDAEIDFLN